MPIALLMPALSPTMTEGNIAKWLKKVGDEIVSGDVIAEVETDKATMEVEAIDEGKLAAILRPEGSENISVNDLIGVIALESDSEDDIKSFIDGYSKKNISKKDTKPDDNNKSINTDKDNIDSNDIANEESKSELLLNKIENNSEVDTLKESKNKIFISPLARRLAELKNIDISKIVGSGPKGRIIKRDLDLSINNDQNSSNNSFLENNTDVSNSKEVIKISNIRKTIAKRLQEAKSKIPHFYLKGKVEVDNLFNQRLKINSFFKDNDTDIKVSLNDYFIKAIALSLIKIPEMNCTWNDNMTLTKYSKSDVSVAVATDEGLFTPVVRNACSKSISNISNEMKNFVVKAKEGKLLPEEYSGGTFSISNLGMYDVIDFSAIINPPQSGIIALGKIIEEPVVINNEIKIVKTISYTLSVDHRIVDGATAANFLKYFNFYIKNPISMLV